MMRWLDGITNGHEFEQALGDGEGQGDLAYCSPRDSQECSPAPQFKASILQCSDFSMR